MAFAQFDDAQGFRPMNDINMTPLIDVMLVLLVIFMLTAPLLTGSVKLNLPQGDSGVRTSQANDVLEISITAKQQWYVGNTAFSADAVRAQLKQIAQTKPQTELRIRADQTVPYGTIASLMAYAQNQGITRIGLLTDPQEK